MSDDFERRLQDLLTTIVQRIDKASETAHIARAETIVLRNLCGVLFAEISMQQNEPEIHMDWLLTNLSGILEGALSQYGESPIAVAQTEVMEQVRTVAEQHLARRRARPPNENDPA